MWSSGGLQGESLEISRLMVFRDILPKVSGSLGHCITPGCDVDPVSKQCMPGILSHSSFIHLTKINSVPSLCQGCNGE